MSREFDFDNRGRQKTGSAEAETTGAVLSRTPLPPPTRVRETTMHGLRNSVALARANFLQTSTHRRRPRDCRWSADARLELPARFENEHCQRTRGSSTGSPAVALKHFFLIV